MSGYEDCYFEEAKQIVERNKDNLVGVVYALLLENAKTKQKITNLELEVNYIKTKL